MDNKCVVVVVVVVCGVQHSLRGDEVTGVPQYDRLRQLPISTDLLNEPFILPSGCRGSPVICC